MPRATKDPTTPSLRAPDASQPLTAPLTGDALILSLAALYRELDDAVTQFDREAAVWDGTMQTYLRGQLFRLSDRTDSLHSAMCSIQASGLPGAMVQAELLHLMVDDVTSEIEDQYRQHHTQTMRNCLVCSIYNVLARETGRTEKDGINVLHTWRDEMRADLAGLMAQWKPMLEAGGRSAGNRKSKGGAA